jgi:hypothetical protein
MTDRMPFLRRSAGAAWLLAAAAVPAQGLQNKLITMIAQ